PGPGRGSRPAPGLRPPGGAGEPGQPRPLAHRLAAPRCFTTSTWYVRTLHGVDPVQSVDEPCKVRVAGVLASGAEAALEPVQLGPQDGGQLVAELLEPLGDLRQLGLPLLDVDAEQPLQAFPVDVQTLEVQALRRRHVADRRLDRVGHTVDALDDPLEDAGVLAESRPEELAVLVAPEPVDVVDPRELGRVVLLADLDPVAEVVAGVVADERQHRHRIAADDTDLPGR